MSEKEPWRIDKESTHWRILKGWLSPFFEEWLSKLATQCQIFEDELLIGITETIRKISYQTIIILKEKTGKEMLIPPFIITPNPVGEAAIIKVVILHSAQPEVSISREKTLEKINPLAKLIYQINSLAETSAILAGKLVNIGITNEFIIAYHQELIRRALESYFKKEKSDVYYFFIKAIIEETLHYFDWQNNRLLIEKFYREKIELAKAILDRDKKARLEQICETKYGFKDRVKEIFEILKNENDLFSPLLEKISAQGGPASGGKKDAQ